METNTAADYGNLGLEYASQGRIDDAISAFRKAILLAPEDTNAHYCLGTLLSQQGLREEAIDSFHQALALEPGHFDALYNLGNALLGQLRFIEAEAAYRRAIILRPDHPAAHANLGNTFKNQGKIAEATTAYKNGIAADPGFANAYYNLGVLQMEQQQWEEAIDTFRQALTLAPGHPALLCNLGLAYRETERLDEAIDCYQKALAADPKFAEAHNNYGNALLALGRTGDAIACFSKAIALVPDDTGAYVNLGNALLELGQLEEAKNVCRQALHLDPAQADTHFNLALALLRTGRLREGWQEYEWRWQSSLFKESRRVFPQHQWDGSNLYGKSILLWAEQGIGDEIRYASMIPEVLKTGANVTIECNERVVEIFARAFVGADVRPAPYREAENGHDEFDFHCSLASLGQFLRNDLKQFATGTGTYLLADPLRLDFWKNRLEEVDLRPKIGLSWSGSVSTRERGHFNASIADLAPILSIPNCSFVSLQSHDSHDDINEAKRLYGADIHTWEDLDLRNDLENIAALTSCLDLVVSLPTFAAEFAGALGVPTFCFHSTPSHIDFLGTGKSVWHPAVRYFTKNEQDEPWQRIFTEMASTIREILITNNY